MSRVVDPEGRRNATPRPGAWTPPAPAMLSGTQTVGLAAAGLALIAVCYGLARFAYGLFVPAFREAFALDAATAGAIASGSYVAYCVGVVVATPLTPRFGSKVMSVVAGVLATAGTALMASAPTAGVLTLGVLIAGSSTGVASLPLAHAIAHRVVPPLRNRLQALVNAGTGLGVVVSGPVALLAQGQWRLAWAAFAVIAAVVTVWVAVTVPSVRQDVAGSAPSRRAGRSWREWLPQGSVRLVGASVTMGAASAATWTFGQDLLTTTAGHAAHLSTVAWIVLGACGLLGAFAGDAANRFGLRTSWVVAMPAMGAATALLAVTAHWYVVAVIATGLFGGVYLALTGLLLVWGTRVFEHRPARGVGLAFLSTAVGQAAAAPLLGAIADHSTLAVAFWVAAGIAVVGAWSRP